MKKYFSYLLIAIFSVTAFTACNNRQPQYQTQWSPDGTQQVAYVQSYDQNGQMMSFWMNYMLFQSLMNRGGYAAVNNYYHSNPTMFVNQRASYASYSPRYAPSTYKGPRGATNMSSYSSPTRNTSTGSTVSKIYRSTTGSSSSSYSSPSRSSSSYSSPSRSSYRSSGSSYSSGRSYSSPSRSYSSPSRSYSSPGRR